MATQEQLQQLQQFFTILDTNGDGKVSIEELASSDPIAIVFTDLLGGGDLQLVFDFHDSDEDGSLTFEEVAAAAEKGRFRA